jgi:hypothetical protein
MHARWVPESFMPHRPRVACLSGCVNLFTSSLVLCLLTSVYPSFVTTWRPTPLASEYHHAQKGSPVPPNERMYITCTWVRCVHAASGRGRAGSVRTSGTLPTLGRIAARLHINYGFRLVPYKSGDMYYHGSYPNPTTRQRARCGGVPMSGCVRVPVKASLEWAAMKFNGMS